jgi:outer membrane receptor for ferrienterochelin and colicin
MVNYTYADGDTTLGDGRQTRFFLQPEQTANFSISYEKGGFSGRIAWKFVGDFIEEYGDSDEQDIYIDDHQQWDLSITQALGNHLSLYLNLVNMNDEPWRRFYGGPFRPFWYETYSWWGSLGLRYNLY